MNNSNEYKGFCLFNDIEDIDLRNSNRSKILANIAEDNTRNRLISPGGAGLILGYFKQIPEQERDDVRSRFVINMKERGYELTV